MFFKPPSRGNLFVTALSPWWSRAEGAEGPPSGKPLLREPKNLVRVGTKSCAKHPLPPAQFTDAETEAQEIQQLGGRARD